MISVFGAGGFIGSAFCEKYKDEVSILQRDELYGGDRYLYLISTVDNYNVLTDPYIDIETNLLHLMKVLSGCNHKVWNTEFTFISSWFVYGDSNLPASEESPCNPKGFYSITKHTAELLIESYCKTFDIKYKIIRLGNVIGKSDNKVSKKKNALQYLIGEMKENRDINLYDGGEFYRDFIGVDDVVEGIKFIMDHGKNGETYNLSLGEPIVFKDIISYIHSKLNSTSKIGTMEASDFHKLVQVKSMYLDTTKLKNLGFTPSKSIYEVVDSLL